MARKYHFTHTLDYTIEAESEDDAIYELVDLIRRDWEDYADAGDLKEI